MSRRDNHPSAATRTLILIVAPLASRLSRYSVERLINRLKQFRRIAMRYEKRAANYLAMVHIGMLLLWL